MRPKEIYKLYIFLRRVKLYVYLLECVASISVFSIVLLGMIHHEMNIAIVAIPIATMIQNGPVATLVVTIIKVVLIKIIMNPKLP